MMVFHVGLQSFIHELGKLKKRIISIILSFLSGNKNNYKSENIVNVVYVKTGEEAFHKNIFKESSVGNYNY